MQDRGKIRATVIKAIVTDIEGTTSSISFVKDVLFPYASQHLEGFVEKNKNNNKVIELIHEVLNIEGLQHSTLSIELQKQAINILQTWIKLDLKIKPLKDLQGLIWEEGYTNRDFYGHIYDDACEKLKEWHKQGIKIYIYSSGSVYAQKLLFGHTKFGDLNYLFSGNFDTSIGHKRDSGSYINIIKAISKDLNNTCPDNILFLSDIEEELTAAADTGISVIKINRDEILTIENNQNTLIEQANFTQIKLD
jgi:enolase-phosphatase E1